MNRPERQKAISTAAAELAGNAIVPSAIKVGFAALAEEVTEQAKRIADLEAAQCGIRLGDGGPLLCQCPDTGVQCKRQKRGY